ncbi:MAG: hypothetical protein HUJ13_10715 [Hydrogenovibrio crunogenus]|uniref:Sulfite reductase (NADPH) flavoprotein alpha-component n=1 Tax=Hydrogenovibrio crunogenus (strain DSM 25203 / XCL-2) TaxID=317025 RepID=Q31EE0_HYDCU|nr:hypothetical protein [Hydrogenovibrio crunogenus]
MQATVLFNELLTPSHPEKDVYHIGLETEAPLGYLAGDWLMVSAENSPEMVAMVLEKLELSGNEIIELRRFGEMPVKEALHYHLELTQLNPAILNKLKRQYDLNDWADRAEMMAYAEGRDILDLLEAYPFLKGVEVCDLLTPLAPRYYSIASAPKAVGENRVDLVYRKVFFERESRERKGVVTTALSALAPGDQIDVALSKNRNFKLPISLEESMAQHAPVIMVGSGTGVAPFIGFLQEWFLEEKLAKNHQAWLFFGETHEEKSHLFKDMMAQWEAAGLQLRTAFSRDQAHKVYVQDRLWEERVAVWKLLQQGAFFYLCGDKTRLKPSVEQTMLSILQTEGEMTEDAAEALWHDWKKQRRVQLDVY